MSNRRGRMPSLPPARSNDPLARQLLDGVREQLMRWRGDQGPLRDRVVTFGDLEDGDIGRLNPSPRSGGALVRPPPTTPRRVGPLEGLEAVGLFEKVLVTYTGTNQRNFSHTEIWRNTQDNLGTATLRGTSLAEVYDDEAEPGQTYYYWIRGVSTSGDPGPFNATNGVKAETARDFDYIREKLSSAEWKGEQAYGAFEAVKPTTDVAIDGVQIRLVATTAGVTGSSEPDWSTLTQLGDTISDGSVVWQAVEAGQIPFFIGSDGLVVIEGAAIREATIGEAKIKDLAVTNAKIADLNAAKITAGILTGRTVRTSATGERFEVDSTDNRARFYDENGEVLVSIGLVTVDQEEDDETVLFVRNLKDTTQTARALDVGVKGQNGLVLLRRLDSNGDTVYTQSLTINNDGLLEVSRKPIALGDSDGGAPRPGAIVFAKNLTGSDIGYGDRVHAENLRPSSHQGTTGTALTQGDFLCLGHAPDGESTLFMRMTNTETGPI